MPAETPHPPAVGTPAPPLTLPAIGGGTVSLQQFHGRPVLLSFLRHAG